MWKPYSDIFLFFNLIFVPPTVESLALSLMAGMEQS